MNYKQIIFKHSTIVGILTSIYNKMNIHNKIRRGKHNEIKMNAVLCNNLNIVINGENNIIKIGKYSRIKDTKIYIYGNNNIIEIGERCFINKTEFYIEDDYNKIKVGRHTSMDGPTHLATIESTEINVGEDCMFSSNVNIRTGDSHSIMNLTGERINPSHDIIIGNHCWIGLNTILLKNTQVADNSIIGAASVVTKKFNDSNVIIAGNPAKVIKGDITWERERK